VRRDPVMLKRLLRPSDVGLRRRSSRSSGRRLSTALAVLLLLAMEALPLAAALRVEPPRDATTLACCRGSVCPMSAAPHRRFAGSRWMPCSQRDGSTSPTTPRPPIDLSSVMAPLALRDAGAVVDETPSPPLDSPLGVPGRPPCASRATRPFFH